MWAHVHKCKRLLTYLDFYFFYKVLIRSDTNFKNRFAYLHQLKNSFTVWSPPSRKMFLKSVTKQYMLCLVLMEIFPNNYTVLWLFCYRIHSEKISPLEILFIPLGLEEPQNCLFWSFISYILIYTIYSVDGSH